MNATMTSPASEITRSTEPTVHGLFGTTTESSSISYEEPNLTSFPTKGVLGHPFGKVGLERRSLPSEKCFMKTKLPFDCKASDSISGRTNNNNTDVAVQKIGSLMNTFRNERSYNGFNKEKTDERKAGGTSTTSMFDSDERFSEPSLSLFANKLRVGRRSRSDDSKDSRSCVLSALGRASQIINNIDPNITGPNSASATSTAEKRTSSAITTEPSVESSEEVLLQRPRLRAPRQRRNGVFNLCNTITMEHEEAEETTKGCECSGQISDDDSDDEEEPQLVSSKKVTTSTTVYSGFRLSEPRYVTASNRRRMIDVSEPVPVATSTAATTVSSNRHLLSLLAAHRHNLEENREWSCSSSTASSTSSTALREGECA